MEAAKPDDIDHVRGLQCEAVAWLAVMSEEQWQPGAMGRIASDRDEGRSLEAGIERREVVLALDDGRLVGTVTVDDYADPEFWTPADEPGSALYVHRMIVARQDNGFAHVRSVDLPHRGSGALFQRPVGCRRHQVGP